MLSFVYVIHTYITADTAGSAGHLFVCHYYHHVHAPFRLLHQTNMSYCETSVVLVSVCTFSIRQWDHTWVMPTDGEGEDSH